MSRRKIVVGGVEYKYIIGKSNLKVDGIGCVDLSTLTGEPWRDFEKNGVCVTPKHVAGFIKRSAFV